ncbi:MAG: hypothetical protein M3440_04670 [Chloroflexota bacterium]|nr:hypothetical protein [Chloroflexota bacterium]
MSVKRVKKPVEVVEEPSQVSSLDWGHELRPVPDGPPQTPYTLILHLMSGQTLRVDVETYELTPGEVDEHGNGIPMKLDYSVPLGWRRAIVHLDVRTVAAVEVERSADEAEREP